MITFEKTNNSYHQVDYVGKHVIAGDTDSSLLSLSSVFPDKNHSIDDVVKFSDSIATRLNTIFPDFMSQIFNVPSERVNLIQTKRETVSDKSLFVAKKNYILHIVDKEGVRKESTKYVGVSIKKSNTPKVIQSFLISMVDLIMDNTDYISIQSFILDFKAKYYTLSPIEIGNPTSIKTLTKFEDKLEIQGDIKGFPQHAKGTLIYNTICAESDKRIYSGSKIKLLYVISSENYGCVAFPSDATSTPQCIQNLVIDYDSMWETVQKKIDIYLIPAGMDRASRQKQKTKGFVKF